MAGKSGRSINNVPENPVRKMIFSWEGILVLLLIAVNIFCSMFSQFYNVSSLLRQMPVYLAEVFLMLAMAYILVLGEIDISVGSTVCLSATVACLTSNAGLPFPLVFVAALLTGTACGMVNAIILTTFPELPPMIVTLSTQIIFRGLAEIILGSGGSVSVTDTASFKALAGKVGQVPYILFLVIILAVIFAVILGKTTFGRSVYAIGTNRLTAYYSGIHVQRVRFIIYTVMGTLCGLCAMFVVSNSYGANTTTGENFEMDAIAMAVFGGIMSTGGKGNIAGGVISALIIVCLRVGLGQRNVNAQVILLLIGLLLICTVGLPNLITNIRQSLKKKKS
ncbi:MAG: ABC transporter permease [Lachnospiraceae bacterium]|nr:ABC transporter permease [Lachnospiraceae bacterium]